MKSAINSGENSALNSKSLENSSSIRLRASKKGENSAKNSKNSTNAEFKDNENSKSQENSTLNSSSNSSDLKNSSQNSTNLNLNSSNLINSKKIKNSNQNSQNYFSIYKIKNKLKEHFSRYKALYLAFLLCYAFSVLCRFYWVWWASDFESFKFNNELMIISNDGYVFAEGARDKIAGFHQPNDLSFIDNPLSLLTYFVFKLTPFSFESIILYMSVFVSSLVVLPLLLISRLYGNLKAGVLAALLASIANSYYNRTMAGYFDTDMLVITLPMLIIYALLRLCLKKDTLSLVALPLLNAFYLWYYPSAFTLCCAFIALFFIYALIFHRKENIFYLATVLLLISLASYPWYIELALFALFLALFAFKNELFSLKFSLFLVALAFVFVSFSGALNSVYQQIAFYLFKSDVVGVAQSFAYFNVSNTIQETSNISLSVFMQRISASELAFLLSAFGLILLLKQHKSFILALPMLLLGFLALRGGLRFTIYAVPVMALGLGWAVFWLISQIQNFSSKLSKINFSKTRIYQLLCVIYIAIFLLLKGYIYIENSTLEKSFLGFLAYVFKKDFFALQLFYLCIFGLIFFEILRAKLFKFARYFAIFIAFFFSVGYALTHIYAYKASPVFNQNEVLLLDKLKHIAGREDYVVAWWDYGYPIRYYSDVKTLVDGGKHLGKDNFFPSFILSANQRASANLARLAVEYTEKSFYDKNDTVLQNDLLKAMMRDYDYGANSSEALIFLNALNSSNFALKTPKTREIFIYMPARMSMIFSTVASFSKINLASGQINTPFIFSTALALGSLKDGSYLLSNSMVLSSDFTSLYVGERKLSIHSIVEFNSIKNKEFKHSLVDENGDFFVFYLKENFNLPMQFIIMDKTMFESAFVQMFFFENYDKSLFELVLNEREAKIYRLKR